MKYWWDKLKVVDTNLKLWDNLQALWFDACWYVLIWKWDDSYWTKWDPLTTTVAICPETSDCPNCQPKIKTVTELNWRPEPCGSWDAFIMMDKNWKLKALCKDAFDCPDRYVAADQGDEAPWTLIEKLTVCDNSSPIIIRSKTDWWTHKVCIGWDKSKAWLKFTDLLDTPNWYESPGLVVSNWNSISYVKPNQCSNSDYSYVVYNKKSNAFTTICDNEISAAEWYNNEEVYVSVAAWQTHDTIIQNNNTSHTFSSTDDILKWGDWVIFSLTRPWVYVITCNSTIYNKTEAWLKAARWWLLVNGNPLWDAKYDSRRYTEYVNDFYPNDPAESTSHIGDARELELTMMSFNTTYTYVASWISASNPAKIWFHVALDARVYWDPRHLETPESVDVVLTTWAWETWPKTVIQCVRIWDIPKSYKQR